MFQLPIPPSGKQPSWKNSWNLQPCGCTVLLHLTAKYHHPLNYYLDANLRPPSQVPEVPWNLNTCMLTSTKKQTRNDKRSRPNSMTVLEPSQWISRAKYTREPENTWDPGARTRSCLCPAGSNSCIYGGANTQTHRCIWGQSQFHHTSHWRQDWPEGRLADTRPATLSTAAL